MQEIKVWPHLTIVALVCALLAGGGVALWMKHERTAEAAALPNAARIERVEGQVALNNSLVEPETEWRAVQPNTPISVGDRIYTRDNSRTSLAFTGRNFATLDPNTSLDVLALQDRRTQLALRDGSAIFDVGYLNPGDLFEVGTPYGAVDFEQPGLYQVGLDDNGGAIVSVLSGLAQVVGLGGNGRVGKGEMLSLLGQTAAQVVLSRLQPDDAGYFVDDYYRQRYPQRYDGRYVNYDAYLSDPYYYDPYRQYQGYQYASNSIPGLYDLDYYGDWVNLDNYGYSWRPRVDDGWAPYQYGSWTNDYPYGPTWVSSEPWGYAPYHYGRWVNAGNQWFWVPDGVNTQPTYSPALVAFVPMESGMIGWVPLAPADAYAPRYYDTNWQPHYVYGSPVIDRQMVNWDVPGAVTIIPLQEFGNVIDYKSLRKMDKRMYANSRPIYDPLTVGPLRNAFLNSAWGRGKIDLPPGIAKKLYARQVVSSAIPVSVLSHKDLKKVLHVESVPDKARGQQLKIRDERQDFKGRAVRVDDSNRGRDAKQDMKRLERDQFEQNRKQEENLQRFRVNQARQQQQAQKAVERQQQENLRRNNESRGALLRQAEKVQRKNSRQDFGPPPRQIVQPVTRAPQATQKAERHEFKQQARPQQQQQQPQQKVERKQERPQQAANAGGGKGKGKGRP